MRILVCVKRVPAPGARIVLTDDAQAIDTSLLSFTVGPHEECAIEEAVRLAESQGGTVTVMTLGPADAEEQLRSALAVGVDAAAVGVDAAALVTTDGGDWDPISTAEALTRAIGDLETEGTFDLILFGNESADSGGHQVGIRVARALGRPIVSGVKGIDVADDGFTLRRDTPVGVEIYRIPTPAAVAVKEGINLPRYPTLKGRLNAKKAEVQSFEQERTGSGQAMVRLVTPRVEISEPVILGFGPEAAGAAVDLFEEIQVLGP